MLFAFLHVPTFARLAYDELSALARTVIPNSALMIPSLILSSNDLHSVGDLCSSGTTPGQ